MKKKDRWPELCEMVQADDGLLPRDCGPWTEDKLYFWNTYVDITTTAMVGHPKWGGLIYVDLFAGPGVCRIRGSGKRLPGSALVAAFAPKPFQYIHLAELDPICAAACRQRMDRSPAADRYRMHLGDCNQTVHEIAKAIPKGCLTLAFIDPPSLDIHFETLRALCTGRPVDLLILLADATDAVRNVDLYESLPESKLDLMLGDRTWRERWKKLPNRDGNHARTFFASEFINQLRSRLGYSVFGQHGIESRRGPLYRLVYASRNELGIKFWNQAVARDSRGQSGLFRSN